MQLCFGQPPDLEKLSGLSFWLEAQAQAQTLHSFKDRTFQSLHAEWELILTILQTCLVK